MSRLASLLTRLFASKRDWRRKRKGLMYWIEISMMPAVISVKFDRVRLCVDRLYPLVTKLNIVRAPYPVVLQTEVKRMARSAATWTAWDVLRDSVPQEISNALLEVTRWTSPVLALSNRKNVRCFVNIRMTVLNVPCSLPISWMVRCAERMENAWTDYAWKHRGHNQVYHPLSWLRSSWRRLCWSCLALAVGFG